MFILWKTYMQLHFVPQLMKRLPAKYLLVLNAFYLLHVNCSAVELILQVSAGQIYVKLT